METIMTAKAAKEQALTGVLVERWEQVSRKLANVAEELPVDKFEWVPVTGIRSCGDVVRHVAFWNRYVTASLRGQHADDSANELSAADYPTKEKVLAVLRSSASEVAAALRDGGDLPAKSVELVLTFLEHTSEHYGQLAVYSRLMGIVPPASRT
jgi:uncharacterized damage-inducible protein DinB